MISEVNKMGMVEREAKTVTGQSGTYFMTFMGPHQVVMYSPVRPDRYGVIRLFFKDRSAGSTLHYIKLPSHYQLLSPTFNDPILLLAQRFYLIQSLSQSCSCSSNF